MDSNIIRRLFPRKLLDNNAFSIYVDLASMELNKVFDYISLMTTLSNVDRCPEEFIAHLGELVNFDWSNLLGSEEQRECMKLYWDATKCKGTKEDLEYMATFGDVDGYLGGKVFVPGSSIFTEFNTIDLLKYYEELEELMIKYASYYTNREEIVPNEKYYKDELIGEDYFLNVDKSLKPTAIVSLGREHLFTFDSSELDGEHYIPDNIVYKEGTILIEVFRLNETIMKKVETVKPAGMIVVYKVYTGNTYEYITHTRTISEVNG